MIFRTIFRPSWRLAFVFLALAFSSTQRAHGQGYLVFIEQINDLLKKTEGAAIYDMHLTGESTIVGQSFAHKSLTRILKTPRLSNALTYHFEFAWSDGWKPKWGRKNIGQLNDKVISEIILEFEKPSKSTVDGSACCTEYTRYFYFLSTDAERAYMLFQLLQYKL